MQKIQKKTVTMEFIRKNDTLKVELHAWGAYDPQSQNQTAKSAIYIGDSTKDVRGSGYGMGIVIVNLRNGGVVTSKKFNLYGTANSGKELTKHLKDLPPNHAIIATTEYTCHQYWKDCRQALREYNFSFWDIKQYESCIFVATTDKQCLVCEKKEQGKGPIKKTIYLPLLPSPVMKFEGYFDNSGNSSSDSKNKNKNNNSGSNNNGIVRGASGLW